MDIGKFIYDYQTLITGGAAIFAAYFAAQPVYNQLVLLRTQSDGVLRAMLLDREQELINAKSALRESVDSPLGQLRVALYRDEDEPRLISEEDAFHFDQQLSRSKSWLDGNFRWRLNDNSEAARLDLLKSLSSLIDLLDEVHRPAHTEQFTEDYTISDVDWGNMLARSTAARYELDAQADTAKAALHTLVAGIDRELSLIRARLRRINQALLR